jgi:hypothetical protein
MSLETQFHDSITIERPTFTQTASKNQKRTMGKAWSGKGRIVEGTIAERDAQGRKAVIGTHSVLLPRAATIAEKDEIVHGAVRYLVHAVFTRRTARRVRLHRAVVTVIK